jgi:hypothetical protein
MPRMTSWFVSCSLALAVLTLRAGFVCAYSVPTHQAMSGAALDASVVALDDTVLENLGLAPLAAQQRFPASRGTPFAVGNPLTVGDLIQEGAALEDTLTLLRPKNHFYDPRDDAPRRGALTECAVFAFCDASPDFALAGC